MLRHLQFHGSRLCTLFDPWQLSCLFNVTINDISFIYVTAHRCAGGLKKNLDLRSGSQRHIPMRAGGGGGGEVKSRMCPPYTQRDRQRRLNGAVCRTHRIKRVVPCRCS